MLPPKPDTPPGALPGELLRTLLKICGERAQIAPAPWPARRADALARGDREGLSCLKGWRKDLFGDQALQLLDGNLWLGLSEDALPP